MKNKKKIALDYLDRTDIAVGELSYDVRTEIPVPESPIPRFIDELGFYDELLNRECWKRGKSK